MRQRRLARRNTEAGPFKLIIKTAPHGALVSIDGHAVGTSPLERILPAGTHEVSASLHGYAGEKTRVKLTENKVITLTLKALATRESLESLRRKGLSTKFTSLAAAVRPQDVGTSIGRADDSWADRREFPFQYFDYSSPAGNRQLYLPTLVDHTGIILRADSPNLRLTDSWTEWLTRKRVDEAIKLRRKALSDLQAKRGLTGDEIGDKPLVTTVRGPKDIAYVGLTVPQRLYIARTFAGPTVCLGTYIGQDPHEPYVGLWFRDHCWAFKFGGRQQTHGVSIHRAPGYELLDEVVAYDNSRPHPSPLDVEDAIALAKKYLPESSKLTETAADADEDQQRMQQLVWEISTLRDASALLTALREESEPHKRGTVLPGALPLVAGEDTMKEAQWMTEEYNDYLAAIDEQVNRAPPHKREQLRKTLMRALDFRDATNFERRTIPRYSRWPTPQSQQMAEREYEQYVLLKDKQQKAKNQILIILKRMGFNPEHLDEKAFWDWDQGFIESIGKMARFALPEMQYWELHQAIFTMGSTDSQLSRFIRAGVSVHRTLSDTNQLPNQTGRTSPGVVPYFGLSRYTKRVPTAAEHAAQLEIEQAWDTQDRMMRRSRAKRNSNSFLPSDRQGSACAYPSYPFPSHTLPNAWIAANSWQHKHSVSGSELSSVMYTFPSHEYPQWYRNQLSTKHGNSVMPMPYILDSQSQPPYHKQDDFAGMWVYRAKDDKNAYYSPLKALTLGPSPSQSATTFMPAGRIQRSAKMPFSHPCLVHFYSNDPTRPGSDYLNIIAYFPDAPPDRDLLPALSQLTVVQKETFPRSHQYRRSDPAEIERTESRKAKVSAVIQYLIDLGAQSVQVFGCRAGAWASWSDEPTYNIVYKPE